MNTNTTTTSQGRRIPESEVIRTVREAIRELGSNASLSDIEQATCNRLGLEFGDTFFYSLHELSEAVLRREPQRERLRRKYSSLWEQELAIIGELIEP